MSTHVQATQEKSAKPARLSFRNTVMWLTCSFVAPFLLVAVISIACAFCLMGNNSPQISTLLLMGAYYGLLSGILGFAAVAISFLAGKYWFLLASFTVPTLLIGGFWGTWGWFKHCDDLSKTYPEQPAGDLLSTFVEWVTYVGGGCLQIGLVAGLAVSLTVVFFYFKNGKNKKIH